MKNPYNSDTIYYIKYKGEIYECKFTEILVKIPHIENPDMEIESNIVQISLEVPGDHVSLTYSHWLASTNWSPFNIYSSVEDCIAKQHPLFKEVGHNWAFSEPLQLTYKDLEDDKAKWERNDKGVYLMTGWKYSTDSYTAKKWAFSSHKIIRANTTDLTSSYPIYDIVNKCWWGEFDWLSRYYSSKETCLKLNAPIIHRF